MSLNRLLSIDDTCEYLAIKSRQTIYNWVEQGILRPTYLPNGFQRFRLSDIERIIRNKKGERLK